MTGPVRCPDCGREVDPGADLCTCGFPLMFLRQEQASSARLKPSRRPAQDGDTDELPVVVTPLDTGLPPGAEVPPPAPVLDGIVCASCEEVNPASRTWCARCGAALRERGPVTAELPQGPDARAPGRGRVVALGLLGLLLLGGAGAAAVLLLGDGAPGSGGEVQPLDGWTVTASATASPGVDGGGAATTYTGANVGDEDLTTAWRVRGDAVGQRLVLELDDEREVTRVGLVPGLAKTDPVTGDDRFAENGRVTRVRWRFDEGEDVVQEIATPAREWARVTLDAPVTTRTVTLVVEASQPGSRREHTAISEVEVEGR